MKRKLYILIAGTYREFLDFCKEQEENPVDIGIFDKDFIPPEFIYYHSRESVLGLSNVADVIFYGTYYKRTDLDLAYLRMLKNRYLVK